MSFGFALGDFIAVGNLAWKVYRSCKHIADEFEEVGREALAAHTIVKELEDEAHNERSVLNRSGHEQKVELNTLVAGLCKALEELDGIIRKYNGLTRRERRIWKLRLATKDLKGIREKLNYHLTAINAFTSGLSRGTLARVEDVLLELVQEVRAGQRPPSFGSIDQSEDITGWQELENELEQDGITAADVAEHKAAIRLFLVGRLRDRSSDEFSLSDVASFVETGGSRNSIDETLSNLHLTLRSRASFAASDSTADEDNTVVSIQQPTEEIRTSVADKLSPLMPGTNYSTSTVLLRQPTWRPAPVIEDYAGEESSHVGPAKATKEDIQHNTSRTGDSVIAKIRQSLVFKGSIAPEQHLPVIPEQLSPVTPDQPSPVAPKQLSPAFSGQASAVIPERQTWKPKKVLILDPIHSCKLAFSKPLPSLMDLNSSLQAHARILEHTY